LNKGKIRGLAPPRAYALPLGLSTYIVIYYKKVI
jgi:hypothetical protein